MKHVVLFSLLVGCSSTAKVKVTFDGLPTGVASTATAALKGSTAPPIALAAGNVELPAGCYTIDAGRPLVAGTIAGKRFQGTATPPGDLCVKGGEAPDLKIAYAVDPSSPRVWVTTSNTASHTLAFGADELAAKLPAGGAVTAVAKISGTLTATSPLTFDPQGNLWVGDTTGKAARYPSSVLSQAASNAAPDVQLDFTTVCEGTAPCGPFALAFDATGNLWASVAKNRVVRLAPSALTASAMVPSSAIKLEGTAIGNVTALTFAASGDLWVARDDNEVGAVMKITAAHASSDTIVTTPDIALTVSSGGLVLSNRTVPTGLAFDAGGNLWVGFFGGNVLAKLTSTDQSAAGTITPAVQITMDVLALITDVVPDGSGGLWLPGKQGQLIRIADAASIGAGFDPATSSKVAKYTSADLGYAEKIFVQTPPATVDTSSCTSGGGKGSITLSATGLPAGAAAKANAGTTALASGANADIPAGVYTVKPGRVVVPGEPAGAAYSATASPAGAICVKAGQDTPVSLAYAKEPGSQRLWLVASNSTAHTYAFDGSTLASGGAKTAATTISGSITAATALVFDFAGNLWVGDSNGHIDQYAMASLGGATISTAPDVELDLSSLCGGTVPCGPFALAMDGSGNLWASFAQAATYQVVRIDRAALTASASPPTATSVKLTGTSIGKVSAMAFNAAGDLWLANDDQATVVKFAASRLTAAVSSAADVTLTMQTPMPVVGTLTSPSGLAFDGSGNLWVAFFDGNVLARLSSAEQATSNLTLTPAVQITIGVTALITDVVLDGAGDVWLPGVQGEIMRLQFGAEPPALGNATTTTYTGGFQYAEKLFFQTPPPPVRSND